MKLKQLWDKRGIEVYNTDKEYTHKYLDTYDDLFTPFQNRRIGIVEMGYGFGGSGQLWLDYFHKAKIRFIDIVDTYFPKEIPERLSFILKNIHNVTPEDFKGFNIDIAIDDGEHGVKDQITFINLIYPLMRKGGLLIIEDVHDIENNKKFFDELNIPFEVIDLRHLNDNPVNVLIVIKK
jgi:hypothetical protein